MISRHFLFEAENLEFVAGLSHALGAMLEAIEFAGGFGVRERVGAGLAGVGCVYRKFRSGFRLVARIEHASLHRGLLNEERRL